ncbi:hypothetical protein IID20_00040 [Patescibacteria group bacterium]|nr:hypothetical protein [Patescibacteria group bacterium]
MAKSTEHHKIPRSRGGHNKSKKNIKNCSKKIHSAYNTLFTNFYLKNDEIILILKTFGQKKFTRHRQTKDVKKFETIWKIIFEDKKIPEIISILQTAGPRGFFKGKNSEEQKEFNNRWKKFFRLNLEPDEIILFLKIFGQEKFLKNRLYKNIAKNKEAWKTLNFEYKTDQEVIEIFKQEWS